MLVLSRQRDETIMIGDDIEITIVDIRGDKVRLGITAPATIPVHRKEVYEAIQRENRAASQVKMEDMQSLPKTGPGGKGGEARIGSTGAASSQAAAGDARARAGIQWNLQGRAAWRAHPTAPCPRGKRPVPLGGLARRLPDAAGKRQRHSLPSQ